MTKVNLLKRFFDVFEIQFKTYLIFFKDLRMDRRMSPSFETLWREKADIESDFLNTFYDVPEVFRHPNQSLKPD